MMKHFHVGQSALLLSLVAVVEAGKKEEVCVLPATIYLGWSTIFQDAIAFLLNPTVAISLAICFSVLVFAPHHKNEFMKEFIGIILMIACTFTPGPFYGTYKGYEEWVIHMCGVIVADYLMGGPHVNPSVTTAMFVWRKISLQQWIVYIAAQMAGGIIAFPLVQELATPYGATIGGPGIGADVTAQHGMWNEFAATFLLLAGIFLLCTTWLGALYHIKQPLVAATIRGIIVTFGATGPAINPALGTTWAFYAAEQVWPTSVTHYMVYWVASMSGAALATILWSIFSKTGPFEEPETPMNLDTAASAHFEALKKVKYAEILAGYTPTALLSVKTCSSGNKHRAVHEGPKEVGPAIKKMNDEIGSLSNTEFQVDSDTKVVSFVCNGKGGTLAGTVFFNDDFLIHREHMNIMKN
uniref:SnoaL-like domain-containing protein n=2 Tax=Octactis speculum TaxID=3111310 RepID=A0A7S2GV22_9STRA|mmetsp:Transcript_58208/g.79362  ORF Transcript_58208/g.79362 Transcript_58208/m.79362 type:complete len:411 (+) Transcript_58208:43-1275(+)|eukprot:CAMPEP_0185771416 /NCGR_PEP_ID=MMETSP1174-20130828/64287_1 /TAXON_ID=35687 /ORGANISM="Dictyocha speculum, Strain CCMP1381" /LENGTH=410 /DNA_ID=CAMNT_0028457285 /DNA_START=42 /DNA_END=1274 /DNA_ORIENTATION=+